MFKPWQPGASCVEPNRHSDATRQPSAMAAVAVPSTRPAASGVPSAWRATFSGFAATAALTFGFASTGWAADAAPAAAAPGVAPAMAAPAEASPQTVRMAEAAFTRGTPLPAWARPLRPLPPKQRDEAYVLRLAQTQFFAGAKPGTLVHRVVQANQSSALAQIGQLQVAFVPHYQRLTLHALKVQRGDEVSDRTRSVAVRFLDSEPGLDLGIYSGSVLANLLLEDVRVGDLVMLTYSIEGANPVFRDQFSEFGSWDRSEGTDLRVVELVAPAGKRPDWRMIGPSAAVEAKQRGRVTPTETTVDGFSVSSFEERALAGVEDEAQVPSDETLYRTLQFSSYRSWAEVAKWAQELFPPVRELPPEVNTLLAEWRKLPTPEARAAAALRWVQSEVRYFSVSFGESSHRPYAPAEVIARRYGDCKDKSYLLVSLLRAMDIEARPVLVALRQQRGAVMMLPTPHAFDHVIVEVQTGGRRYYIDGTRFAQDVPLPALSPPLPRAVGLPVDAGATALIELPGTPAELAFSALDERIQIKRFDEPPLLEARATMSGFTAELTRFAWRQATAEQKRQLINAGYEKRYPGAQPIGEPELTDDLASNKLVLTARFKLPNAIRERDGNRAVGYSADNFAGFFAIPEKPRRTAPALVGLQPWTARYNLSVEWPDNVSRGADPTMTKIDNEYFKGEIEHQFRGNTHTMRAEISSKVDIVAPGKLTAMRDEVRKFEGQLGTVSFVPATAVKSSGFLGLGKQTLPQRLRRDAERLVDATSAAIKGGKLVEDDLASAHCERGTAHSSLENISESLADGDMAVKLAPANAAMHACRGELRFNAGDFAGSISDFSKAITLASSPGSYYYRRGHSRFFVGQYEAAAGDFARAADAKFNAEGGGAAHYAQLWQVWALQRSNQPLPEKLQAQIKAEANGPWPRAALAMLLGIKTPEQVLAEVNAMAGDEREMNLAEAHFYVGEHWLSRGDVERAKREFETARSKGIILYIEHVAAGHELKRLAK